MTPDLAAFSDWVLALLPRLFLYPGGVWMLAGVVVIRFAGGGRLGLRPQGWVADLVQMNPLAVALAWVGLALVPLPGAAALPSPVDRWVIVALVAVSLLFSLGGVSEEAQRRRGLAGAGIALALLAPLAGADRLVADIDVTWAARIGFFAVGLGITALIWAGDEGLGSEVRALAWGGLALMPLWPYLPDSWLSPTIAVFLVVAFVWRGSLQMEIPATWQQMRPAVASQWLLAMAALLAALLVRE